DGDLVCLETAKGKLVWRYHLAKDFKGIPGFWSYGESVLIDGDHLLCTPGGPEATILCLNKKNGKVVWKTPIEAAKHAAYASIVIAQVGKTKQYVQFIGAAVIGVDAKTGKLLWRNRKNVGGVNAATPIVHDGHVFTSASGNEDAGGDLLLKLSVTDKGA